MSPPPGPLPSEVWSQVFGYLPMGDKLSVRASCKYFRRLVDHCSLWRDWVVVLEFPRGSYNSRFWSVLRRRRVSAAVVRGGRLRDWGQLAAALPSLRTLVVERSAPEGLIFLRDFAHLRRLSVRCGCAPPPPQAFTASQLQQLTHLGTCAVSFPDLDGLLSAVCRFPNLTSLLCHETGICEDPWLVLRSILGRLPKLEHLSLSTTQRALPTAHHKLGSLGEDGAPALSSLELLNYQDETLPLDVMRLLPGLRSLTVFYRDTDMANSPPPRCDLEAWCRDLPLLTTLVVVRGPPLRQYISSIPTSVTDLVLCVPGVSSQDLAVLAARLPNLLCLHIDPWPSPPGGLTARIPQLFPNLTSLKLRHERVPEDQFLNLHKLKDLKYLEVLDSCPDLSRLAGKLQTLTNHRLRVAISPRQRQILNCPCVHQVH